ncbi:MULTISPECIES: hypothetical protein [unclassified Variovorax]|uniref:hypothetical protein n=1 Tax=unclassified Variovorax TaxID=663243 RepID=UPI0025761A55|nr:MULTISPECIES: hypothetical protein [unclassified Variovorax]MDM0087007.1 hypothetical protein [Variovorax sp. J22G40]MDM0144736.1 hypothetical protein [Variovorax sp. J2P1-31]
MPRTKLGASYSTRRQPPTGKKRPGARLSVLSTKRSPRVNSIIYIVGLVVVVVAVLSFFGLR